MPKKKDTTKPNYLNNDAKLLKLDLMTKFYNKEENLRKMIDFVKLNKDQALRRLEWLCNNYSKKNNIIHRISTTKEINIFLDYKACLDSYKKRKFDPYKRWNDGYGTFEIPINFPDIPTLKKFETTVGQLNFFRWCIKNKILEYLKNNELAIKNDLKESTPKSYNAPVTLKKPRKKRVTLSVSATKSCIKNPSSNKMVKF